MAYDEEGVLYVFEGGVVSNTKGYIGRSFGLWGGVTARLAYSRVRLCLYILIPPIAPVINRACNKVAGPPHQLDKDCGK